MIRLPYIEPFLYAGWMVPLNWATLKLLRQIPVIIQENIVEEALFSLSSSCLILSLFMKPLPAVNLIEVCL